MAGNTRLHAPGIKPMNPEEFKAAKLMGLLMFVSMMQKDFWFDESLVPGINNAPPNSPQRHLATDKAKQLVDGYLALMSAVCKLFPAPGELETAVRALGLSMGIQIEVDLMAPSSNVPQ